jgi:hypothetical protein
VKRVDVMAISRDGVCNMPTARSVRGDAAKNPECAVLARDFGAGIGAGLRRARWTAEPGHAFRREPVVASWVGAQRQRAKLNGEGALLIREWKYVRRRCAKLAWCTRADSAARLRAAPAPSE